jgi:integrase
MRARNRQQGLAFEAPLVSDGQGGLRTMHLISSYNLQTTRLPEFGEAENPPLPQSDNSTVLEAFRSKFGLLPCPTPIWPAEDGSGSVGAKQPSSTGGGGSALPSRDLHERPLTNDEIGRLQKAVEGSANAQLKFIVALLMLTRVRQRDLLEARWEHFDLNANVWVVPSARSGTERRVNLSREAMDVIGNLPRWDDCPYLLANPVTKKPYRSFSTSWDTAKIKADLADVEIDDLRFCDFGNTHRFQARAAVDNFNQRRAPN